MKRTIENVVEEEESVVKRVKGRSSLEEFSMNETRQMKDFLNERQRERENKRKEDEEKIFKFVVDLRIERVASSCKNSTCMYSFYSEFQSALRRGDINMMQSIMSKLRDRECFEVCSLEKNVRSECGMRVKAGIFEPLCGCLDIDYYGNTLSVPFTWKNASIMFQIDTCCQAEEQKRFKKVESYFLMVESFINYFLNLKLAQDPSKCKEGLCLSCFCFLFFFFETNLQTPN